MDSSGVGLVMGRYRLVNSRGKKMRVDNLSERDYRIMKMSGIEKLADINQITQKKEEFTYEKN
jgi:stage II sporulation protein AA (anti-sigma F factor antagonist)